MPTLRERQPGRPGGSAGTAATLSPSLCGIVWVVEPSGATVLRQLRDASSAAEAPGQPGSKDAGSDEARSTPTTERRLVSVLFADLVGFTTLSESRDPEEVRELLSRYFDTCRAADRALRRHGREVHRRRRDGRVGFPGRARGRRRAGRPGGPGAHGRRAGPRRRGRRARPSARAGVLTGEAAVTLGAEGQGMVAGDLVNTASRMQSVATPGPVFVGESTMRTDRMRRSPTRTPGARAEGQGRAGSSSGARPRRRAPAGVGTIDRRSSRRSSAAIASSA